jgi:protein involved in sex pheromone biosynthesis
MEMKKLLVSVVVACSAMVMLSGCVVSEDKLTDKVMQGIVEYEQEQGKRLVVTDLKLEKSEGNNYKGVLTGRLDGVDVVYDVTVDDTGSDFDVDWELRK